MPTETLIERQTVDEVRVPPDDQASLRGKQIDVASRVSLDVEVITSDWYASLGYIHALPQYVDELERDFGVGQWGGVSIYAQMLVEPIVNSSVGVVVASALSQHVELSVPNRIKAADPRYRRAMRTRDLCVRVLETTERPFDVLLPELVEGGVAFGHKAAEQIYHIKRDPEYDAALYLTDLKAKPQLAYAFVVDRYYHELGLLFDRPGSPFNWADLVPDPQGVVSGLLPRHKIALFSYQPRNSDPRGTSGLRTVYHPWWSLQQTYDSMRRYIALYGTPPIIGILPPQARDITHDPTTGALLSKPIAAAQAMANTLAQLRAAGIAVLPNGADAHTLQSVGDGLIYTHTIDLHERRIARGILYQTRATMESLHGSRSDSSTGQDILGLRSSSIKTWAELCVKWEILWPLVRYNEGEDARELVPDVSLGEVEVHDLPQLLNSLAAWKQAGGVSDDMLSGVNRMVHLPGSEIQDAIAAKLADPEVQNRMAAIAAGDLGALPVPPQGAEPGPIRVGAPSNAPVVPKPAAPTPGSSPPAKPVPIERRAA